MGVSGSTHAAAPGRNLIGRKDNRQRVAGAAGTGRVVGRMALVRHLRAVLRPVCAACRWSDLCGLGRYAGRSRWRDGLLSPGSPGGRTRFPRPRSWTGRDAPRCSAGGRVRGRRRAAFVGSRCSGVLRGRWRIAWGAPRMAISTRSSTFSNRTGKDEGACRRCRPVQMDGVSRTATRRRLLASARVPPSLIASRSRFSRSMCPRSPHRWPQRPKRPEW